MNDLRDMVEEVERAILRAREEISKGRQITSDRGLQRARDHLAAALRAIDRGRAAGTVPRW